MLTNFLPHTFFATNFTVSLKDICIMYVCMYLCMCVCVCMCVCMYVCVGMYVRMYLYVYVCMYVCVCVCMCVCVYIYVYIYIYIYIYIDTHVYKGVFLGGPNRTNHVIFLRYLPKKNITMLTLRLVLRYCISWMPRQSSYYCRRQD